MQKLLPLFFLLLAFVSKAQITDTAKSTIRDSTFSTTTKVDVEASFSGGERAWNEYVMKSMNRAIMNNFEKLSKDKASNGTCEVQFVIDSTGSIINVEAITMKNSLLAKLVIDIIKNGEKWNPCIKDGKPVKAIRRQKVTFKTPDE